MKLSADYLAGVRARADLLHPESEVEAALDRLAEEITDRLADKDPIAICVMNGAVVTAGKLLPRLDFPLRQDYLHATRYRGATQGGEIHWLHRPQYDIKGEHLLIIDDILDEGVTLHAVVDACREAGAASVHCVVLVEKQHDRSNGFKADYVGLVVQDRYLFGYGMDFKGYWRNAPGIFAVAASDMEE